MELIRPNEEYLSSYAEACQEDDVYRMGGERRFLHQPELIIEQAYNQEHGIGLPEGWVKATTFWLVDDDKFIGEIGIRHELTPALLKFGGHIGYEVRWSETRKGYGAKMLEMALPYCRDELGLTRVMLTCDDDNIGSQKIIEKNGGVLQDKITNELDRGTVLTRRYWIDLE